MCARSLLPRLAVRVLLWLWPQEALAVGEGTARGLPRVPSVHCLLVAGLEESAGWKVNKTSWRFSPGALTASTPWEAGASRLFSEGPPAGAQGQAAAHGSCSASSGLTGWGGRCGSCGDSSFSGVSPSGRLTTAGLPCPPGFFWRGRESNGSTHGFCAADRRTQGSHWSHPQDPGRKEVVVTPWQRRCGCGPGL